ncbi:MAG TPA: RHS repeat-associated core domain-containing protein [Polyangia bacterium]|nr:RHS repeat-associated core domain-containing protein [Polyangia bacterium]
MSSGSGFRAAGPLDANPELGRQPFQMLDIDGDGLQDFLTVDAQNNIQVYRHKSQRAPMLKQIFDSGLDRHTSVTYSPVARVSTPTTKPCSYPLYCPQSGVWVVSEVQSESQTVPGTNQLTELTDDYSYSGARTDLRGRGWLGMESRTVTRTRADDLATPVSMEVTQYDNSDALFGATTDGNATYVYPRVGIPREVTTTRFNVSTDPFRNDIATRTFGVSASRIASAGNVSYLLQPVLADEQVQESDAGPSSPFKVRDSTWSSLTYDVFGNLTHAQLQETLLGGTTTLTTIDATYLNNANNWLVSQPTSRTLTSSAAGLSATRSWTYTPDPDTGIIGHEGYQEGVPDEQVDVTYIRNGFGLPTNVTSTISTGESRTTSIAYDDVDGTFPTSVTNALEQVSRFTYHPGYGVLVSSTDPNGFETTASYDQQGRIRSVRNPDGTGRQIHYEMPQVLPLQSTYQIRTDFDSGGEKIETHDIWDRIISISTTNFAGSGINSTRIAYDPTFLGQPARVQVPSASPDDPSTPAGQFTYDNAEDLFNLLTPNGSNYDFFYNTTTSGVDNPAVGTAGEHSEETDGNGRVIQVTDSSLNATVNYTYGPFGLLRTATDPGGNVTTVGYDGSGRRTSIDAPNGGHTTLKWNGFGDLVQATDGDGQLLTNIPDPLGRITQMIRPEGTTIYNWDTSANGLGQIGNTTSPDNIDCTYGYDNFGRSSSQAWTLRTGVPGADGTYTASVSYDSQGRPSTITYPAVANQASIMVQITYAANGQMSGVVRLPARTPLFTINTRDAFGHVTSETAGNGVVTTHDYDPATGALQEIKSTSGSTLLRDLVYGYDVAVRLQTRTTDGAVEQFDYDVLNRLAGWEQGSAGVNPGIAFNYDASGNMLSEQTTTFANHTPDITPISQVTFVPGGGTTVGPNEIASSSLGTYSYDQRGDQVAAPNRTVAFNSFGLPHSVTANGTKTTLYYDGSEQRILKTDGQNTIVTAGGLFERRITNGSTVDVFYIYGDGRPVAQIVWTEAGNSVNERVEYFHEDHLQSIEMVTDGSGNVVARQAFTPFGVRIGAPPADVRLGFDGLEEDDESGLINMGSRLYDPQQARFISADSLLPNLYSSQEFNRYAFVANNPLSFRDPTGFDGEPVPQQEDPEDPEPADPLPSTDQSGQATVPDGAGNWTTTAFNDDSAYMRTVAWGGPVFSPGFDGGGPPSGTDVPLPGSATINQARPDSQFLGPQGGNYRFPGNASNTYAANGDYVGPPGGVWGDTSARNGLGIVGPNGEKARDTSNFWLWAPWNAVSYIFGGAALWNLGRSALFGVGVRVFWSGGTSYAGAAAARWAAANGAATLEMTLAGRALTVAKNVFGYRLVKPMLDLASARFAATALGDVHFFMSTSLGISSSSTFLRLELPALLGNPAVQNIGLHLLP